MTFKERLKQKQAGTVKAPASGVSEKMRAGQNQERLYAAQPTPYADAARGDTILGRFQAKQRPNLSASSQPVQTAEEKTDTATRLGGSGHQKRTSSTPVSVLGEGQNKNAKGGSPASTTGRYDPTSQAATGLDSGIPVLTSYGGLSRLTQAVPDNTERTKSQTQSTGNASSRLGGRQHQRRTSTQAVNLAGETAGPVEVAMTPEQMQEEHNRVQKQIQDLDTAWRNQDTESPIMAAMYGIDANTMSREEYDRQRRELQEKADALEKGYRTAKQDGPFTGTYSRELNYAEDRESPLSVSHFAEIMNRADFAQKSQPGERAGGKVFTTSDQELYNYINDIDGARQSYDIRAIRGMGPEYAKYQLMTPEEIKVYNYYANSGDTEGLKEFLGWLEPQLNQQWYSGRQEAMDEFVGQNAGTKALGSAATVLAQPARALTGAAATIQDIYRADRGLEIDPYSPLHQFNRINQGIREEVGEDMSGAGQFLYNTVMSAADSAMNSLTASGIASTLGLTGEKAMEVTGKLGALLMSNEVVASSIAAAKDKGYSDVGAVVLGLLRGGIETASEMIGGEWAIKNIKAHPDQFLRTMLRNGIPEGVEENMSSALNEVVNLLIDNSYGTGESYIGQAYKHYREEGKENPGLWVVLTILEQEGLNFLGGSLSTVGTTGVQWKNYNTGLSMSANALHTDTGTVQQLMEELGTDNPAAVGYMAELADVSDVDGFRDMIREVNETAQEIDTALENRGQQAGEDWYAAPPVVDAQREQTPGVDPRAENDAQRQEEQQRREEQQARESAWYTAPPVEEYRPGTGLNGINNDEIGGINNGEQSDFGEQPGNDAERAGGEAFDNEGRTAAGEVDAGDAEGQGRHRFQDLVREKVTAADLGVDNGSTTATVDVLDDTRFEADSPEARAAQKARDAGLEPVFVTGTLQIGDGAKAKQARAYIKGNRVILQADANVTAEQLLDHELYHRESQRNKALNGIIREALANNMDEQELRDLVGRYITAYDGIYDFTSLSQEKIEEICEEELFADLYAGIDNTGRQELRETAKKAYAEAQTREQQNAEAERETRGPPEGRDYSYPPDADALYTQKDLYSYDFLTHQEDMRKLDLPDVSEVISLTPKQVAEKGMEDVSKYGPIVNTKENGKMGFVKNKYTGHTLRISESTIRHSLHKERGLGAQILNKQFGAIIGQAAENAIPINGLKTKNSQAAGTYAMASYAQDNKGNEYIAILTVEHYTNQILDAEVIDVGHSISGRINKNQRTSAATSAQESPETGLSFNTSSDTLSIADLLAIVNSTHRSILSKDVLAHFNETRPQNGYYTNRALFSAEVGKNSKWNGVEEEAAKHFGTTDDFKTAGYLMQDGRMLDFSGAHWLDGYSDDYIAQWRKKNDIRQVDHEDIFEAFESMGDDYPSDSALEFIKRGNIRMVPEGPGIELSATTEPTAEQYRMIKEFIRTAADNPNRFDATRFNVDLTRNRRSRAGSLNYTGKVNADKVVNDIKHFFQTGEIREESPLAQFRYSVEVPGTGAELEQEYKRRHDAYMAASDANDTEFDYKGEIAWMVEAEKQIGKERAAQIANGEITPGRTDGPVSIDQAEQELLDVGEAVVETENGKYRLQVRRQSNGDYMAKVFKDGGEQVARRFSTPAEAAEFASDYLKGQENGYQDAAEEAERSPEQEPEVPTELPDGKEEEREYIRKKKNETAKQSNPALRDRILRTQSQIDSLKRMDRNPGTRLTEQQRAHIEDLQETLDILVEESNARKQRAKDRRGKAKEAEAKNKESRNKATESARAARSELMKLWHTADGNKAGTADAINKALEEMRKTGRITEESRQKLLDALMDAGTAAVEAESVFADIRREMKNRKIYVSEHDKGDFADWKDFRQRAFAAGLYLTNNQNDPSADVVNEEMAAAYGEKMFPTDVAAQDALENLVKKMEQGREARESLSDAIDHWAELEHVTREEILDDLNRKTDEILRTFGQKAELEVQLKDQTADMLQGERERFEARLERQAQRHRETQIRDKVLRGLKRLERLKGRADPETKPAVEAVLRDIDTHAKSMSIERLEDLQALQRAYNAAREAAGWEDEEHPGNWIPNKYVEERLAALSQKHLNEMDIQDVIDLGRTVLALENTIRTNGQMIGEEFDASVAETSQKVREEVESTKGTRGGFLNRWLMEEHLSPTRFLQHLAGWKNGAMAKLAKSLEDGQTRALDFQRRATQSFDPFLSKKENRQWLEKASGKKATWTEYAAVDGMTFVGPSFTKIELTPMMKVSLYLHSLNDDNLRHIQNGGLVIPNKELYIKGDIKNAYEKGARVKMEPEVVRSIVKELTPQEMLFARYMQKVFNGVSKDAINEVSLQLDGFERAGVDNYMPIESSRNFLKSDVTAEARESTVEGIGSIANDRVGGTNPMVLDDASNVLTRQIDKVSRYYGYAIPIRNFQAVYNRVFPENDESYASSMKEVLGRKWGSGSKQYIEKMLADLQSGGKSKNDPLSRAMSTLRGHLAGATLSFNPAVAISQTASYPGAAQAVGWDGLAHGLVAGRVDPKLIEKYSPLYWYRNQGNSTQELGDYMNGKSLEQKLPWLLNWIQKMDSATIRRLWAASEYRVAKDNPNLQRGTQEEIDAGESEFYKKVAEVFNRAVYDTQPNYTTMERAQILRSESDVTRFLTMYKTVPLQYYGMMVEAAGRLQAARQSGNETQVKQAQKYALDTFGGLLAANSVYVLMKALFKSFRRKDKDYRDEEGNLTAGSVTKQLGKDLAEVYAGSIIGGAEALSLMKYLTKGGTYQAPEMNALGYVEDMAGAVRSIITAMDSQDPRKAAGAVKNAAKTLAMGFGLPASNMETYLLSTIRWASPKIAMEYENMFGGIGKGDLKGMDSKATGIAAGLILSNRTGQRYPESVSQELARLYEAGERGAVPTDIPESFTYGDTEVEIKDRRAYSDAWGEAVGDSLEELLSTDYYQDADDETKARIVDHLFDYATVQARRTADPDYDVTGNSTYGWTARAEEAVANGATLAETITTITAVNAIEGEKDAEGNTISGSVKVQTIAYIDGLDTPDDHKDALYMATLYSGADAREKLEAVEDIGISRHNAITALNDMSGMTADKDADGKSIANSKRDKISAYIDGMDLSDSQKDELFVLMGYKETSLKYTPWHGYQIAGSGTSGKSGGSSSGRSGGSGGGSSRSRSGTSGKTGTLKLPSQVTGSVKVPKAAGSSGRSSSTGRNTAGSGIRTSTESDLIRIIDEMYGGNELAALVDDRRPKGRTKVEFRL